jgi:hypothetical protein
MPFKGWDKRDGGLGIDGKSRDEQDEVGLDVGGRQSERRLGLGKCGVREECASAILSHQPDFMEQRPLVQEVMEEAGHQCLILPKFHCELNTIEFFWGAAKRWLRENCDYTFATLQENTPHALASVPLNTIRKFEHRVLQWVEAYKSGLSAKDAQFEVKRFSSTRYTSHRRIPEKVARLMDA